MDEEYPLRIQPIPFESSPIMPPAPAERSIPRRITDWLGEALGFSDVADSYEMTGDEERFDVETNYSPWAEAMILSGNAQIASNPGMLTQPDLFEDAINTIETNQRRREIRRDIVGTGQWALEQASVPASMLLAMAPGGVYGRGLYGAARAVGTRFMPRIAAKPAVSGAISRFTGTNAAQGVFGRAMEFGGNRLFPALAIAASASREIPGEIGGAGITETGAQIGYGAGRLLGAGFSMIPGWPGRFLSGVASVPGAIAGAFAGSGAGQDYADRRFGETRQNWSMDSWENWDWMRRNRPQWVDPATQAQVQRNRY